MKTSSFAQISLAFLMSYEKLVKMVSLSTIVQLPEEPSLLCAR